MCILCSPQRQDENPVPVKPSAPEPGFVSSTLVQGPILYITFPGLLLFIRNRRKTVTVADGWTSGHASVFSDPVESWYSCRVGTGTLRAGALCPPGTASGDPVRVNGTKPRCWTLNHHSACSSALLSHKSPTERFTSTNQSSWTVASPPLITGPWTSSTKQNWSTNLAQGIQVLERCMKWAAAAVVPDSLKSRFLLREYWIKLCYHFFCFLCLLTRTDEHPWCVPLLQMHQSLLLRVRDTELG